MLSIVLMRRSARPIKIAVLLVKVKTNRMWAISKARALGYVRLFRLRVSLGRRPWDSKIITLSKSCRPFLLKCRGWPRWMGHRNFKHDMSGPTRVTLLVLTDDDQSISNCSFCTSLYRTWNGWQATGSDHAHSWSNYFIGRFLCSTSILATC